MKNAAVYIQESRVYFCGDHLYEWVMVKRRWWQLWKPKSWMEKHQISFSPTNFEWSQP